jgi:hypothetical protein
MVSQEGTQGRVYGGDPNLIHIPDHHRKDVGIDLADNLEGTMRLLAIQNQGVSFADRDKKLCPGCYMIAGIDMMLVLADRNGQDRRELALTLVEAFKKLADDPNADLIEEVHVVRS